MNDTIRKRYSERLLKHIDSVREFGRKLGLPEKQLQEHDLSKWEPVEFEPYAAYFGNEDWDWDLSTPEMARAWLHHIHHNPHHWQHWIFPDGYNPSGAEMENGVMKMPSHYVMEMIADWHGASYAYTGDWDISKWLYENMPRILVHSETAEFLCGQLDLLSYADVVYVQKWKSE